MIRDRTPPTDAEKCGTQMLLQNFRLPPAIRQEIDRSLLLIGTRGSGKTYYLRRYRHIHEGTAFLGDLKFIVNPVTRDTGAAGLGFELIPPSLELPIRAKTAALLAAWLAEEARSRRIESPWKFFERLLPVRVHTGDNVYLQTAAVNVHDFRASDSIDCLLDFARELDQRCERSSRPAAVLLDRAEDVPYPGLAPVLSLLDQSNPFLTIIAARPGLFVPPTVVSGAPIIPGDHYDVQHLGASPYSRKWHGYMEEVLKAWVPNAVTQHPAEKIELVLNLCRDSLRNPVKLVYNSIDETTGSYNELEFDEFFKMLQGVMLKAAQGYLRHLNPRLLDFLASVRRRTRPLILPVLIDLRTEGQVRIPLADVPIEMSADEKFLRLALRSGFFTTLDGEHWHPYSSLEEVEIPPLFIWRKGDPWYSILDTS